MVWSCLEESENSPVRKSGFIQVEGSKERKKKKVEEDKK
jgi:hypothetical protein